MDNGIDLTDRALTLRREVRLRTLLRTGMASTSHFRHQTLTYWARNSSVDKYKALKSIVRNAMDGGDSLTKHISTCGRLLWAFHLAFRSNGIQTPLELYTCMSIQPSLLLFCDLNLLPSIAVPSNELVRTRRWTTSTCTESIP